MRALDATWWLAPAPFGSGGPGVELPVPLGDRGPSELPYPLVAGQGDRPPASRIVEQELQCGRERRGVERIDQDAVPAAVHELRGAPAIGGHDGGACLPRFEHHDPEGLAATGHHEQRGPPIAPTTSSRESRPGKCTRPATPNAAAQARRDSRAGPAPAMTRSAVRRPWSIAANAASNRSKPLFSTTRPRARMYGRPRRPAV